MRHVCDGQKMLIKTDLQCQTVGGVQITHGRQPLATAVVYCLALENTAGRVKRRVRDRLGNGNRHKHVQYLHAQRWGYARGSGKEKRLILSGRMQAQMSRCVQMAFIVSDGPLMSLEMGCRIQGENMMLVIELMSEYFAVERPAEGIGEHAHQ